MSATVTDEDDMMAMSRLTHDIEMAKTASHHDEANNAAMAAKQRGMQPPAIIIAMSPEQRKVLEKKLRLKIDLRILPMIILMYILNYIDRNNIAAARFAGLEDDLDMDASGTQFSTAVGILFVGYIIMQVPSNLLLNKIGKPGVYLPTSVYTITASVQSYAVTKLTGLQMVIWGAISAATAGCHSVGGLYACRFFLGFVEATYFVCLSCNNKNNNNNNNPPLPPAGCLYYLSCWYTREELGVRTTYLYAGSLISGAFSGLISAGITGNMDRSLGLRAWRWLFIIEGAVTVAVALAAYLIMPNFPKTTTWLSEEESALASWRLEEDIGSADWTNSEEQTLWHGFRLALMDIKTWILLLLLWGIVSAASVTNFFPTVVSTLGYNNVITLLLTSPPYVLAVITCFIVAHHADKTGERFLHVALPQCLAIATFIIAAATTNLAARYVAMVLMIPGLYSGYTTALAWISNTLPRPPAKRAAALGFINAISNCASIYTPYLYPSSASPQYTGAFIHNCIMSATAIVAAFILRIMLVRLNKRLDRGERVEGAVNAAPGEAVEHGFRPRTMSSRVRRENTAVIVVEDDSAGEQCERTDNIESRPDEEPPPDLPDKVKWSDQSDDDGGAPVKPAKKRRVARRYAGSSNRKRKGKRSNKTRISSAALNDDDPSTDEDGNNDDDLEFDGVPEYVRERRRIFEANRRLRHEAALMLPPDYAGIVLDEMRRPGDVEARPKFDATSGIRPSRPYRDIELPQSGGLIPAPIATYLRDYQVDGVKFLHRKFVYQEGGILGDDMGLGKTVQVAAFLAAAFGKTGDERDAKRLRRMRYHNDRWYPRVLIICPGSLIVNWQNELSRWGWWHVDVFHGADKDDVMGTARAGLLEVMITTYDTYKNSRSSVNMVPWDAVIADECHRIKDRCSETTKAMVEVNALCRIGLTGTAIQNRYEELWTLLDWTNPGHFGSLSEWRDTVAKPLAIGQSHEATMAQLSLARQTAQKLVRNLLPRYFLRRMKTLIAHQLPKKTDKVVFCPLTDLQRDAYENFLGSPDIDLLRTVSDKCPHGKAKGWCCKTRLSDGTRTWQSIVFPSMIVLQKLANHVTLLIPQATDLESKQKSELETLQTCIPGSWKELYAARDQIRSLVNPEFCGKWKVLRKLLRFWHANKDKVLIFSHSVRLLRILQHLFHNTSYNVSYLDGSLGYEARQDVVDSFNSDPNQFVFLISTKAGGVGLNITSANKVVIVDPHWNPSYDLQAQDRAYRIGQTRDVEVFRLISLGTVEEIVYARQIYKQQQANIGYTASSERRYFRGVQQDTDRKGEIFGLANIFTYHSDSGLLRDIVNKTNIAEARLGVSLADVDMEEAAKEHEDFGAAAAAAATVKKEDNDGGVGHLADLLVKSENPNGAAGNHKETTAAAAAAAAAAPPRMNAIQAILTSAGVEYTHENADVVGSSRVEEQLSRQAAMGAYADDDMRNQHVLFATSLQGGNRDGGHHCRFNPPADVQRRQFCDMAREFGFRNATDFALVVESWTGEERRRCLDEFYRRRQAKFPAGGKDDTPRITSEKKGGSDDGDAKDNDRLGMGNTASSLASPRAGRELIGEEVEHGLTNETKDEVKFGVKHEAGHKVEKKLEGEEAKNEVKEETRNDVEDVEDVKVESKKERTNEPQMVRVDRKTKRTSIFLSDDDDDDEL
ncbi:DNA excision repair protein ERCC-6-like 2 [Geosmithia morbida]|uniref:DNA excision repair protein ERCC-6-like 2 n=1 Tax=Geosmithia morbida TaxID=1094350 RepID=A0A9P4YYV3_9HYPO|nr:DNA excision repair protein ERCC-6-like 2 [Geosmithia morbida]KAF4124312.1 DNA excision repair protein ERCC-6-like 2 [Geosmithia morbida]